MASFEAFRSLCNSVSIDTQREIANKIYTDPDQAFIQISDICTKAGLIITENEIRDYLNEMDDSDEFDDIELDSAALMAISGGSRTSGGGC